MIVEHVVDGAVWQSLYAHLQKRLVTAGENVTQGQIVGLMGNTGRSSGQHLHFELHRGEWNAKKSNAVNPLEFIQL